PFPTRRTSDLYHIKQVVNTVTKIDIADAAGPVHGFGACGTEPLIGMGSFVSASAISFGFGDDTAGQGLLVYPGAEYHSQEALGYLCHIRLLIIERRKFVYRH